MEMTLKKQTTITILMSSKLASLTRIGEMRTNKWSSFKIIKDIFSSWEINQDKCNLDIKEHLANLSANSEIDKVSIIWSDSKEDKDNLN